MLPWICNECPLQQPEPVETNGYISLANNKIIVRNKILILSFNSNSYSLESPNSPATMTPSNNLSLGSWRALHTYSKLLFSGDWVYPQFILWCPQFHRHCDNILLGKKMENGLALSQPSVCPLPRGTLSRTTSFWNLCR